MKAEPPKSLVGIRWIVVTVALGKVLWVCLIITALGLLVYQLPPEVFMGFEGPGLCADRKVDRMLFWIHRRDEPHLRAALARGANPNRADDNGISPLEHAILAEWPEGCWILLDHGAQPNGGVDCISFPLICAVAHGNPNTTVIVRMLLERGARVDKHLPANGETSLAVAIRNGGRPDVIQLLLAAGADIDRPDNDGVTPRRYLVARADAAQIMRMLEE
jgi:hypothetical protein